MKQQSHDFDIKKFVRLGDLKDSAGELASGQYVAATSILRRLYGEGEPGVILADEVGLGKTFVSFGVAAWVLSNIPKSRVLVLTNSRYMVDQWSERWGKVLLTESGDPLPLAVSVRKWLEYKQLRPKDRLAICSYETLKLFWDEWDQIRASVAKWIFDPRFRPGTKFSHELTKQLKRDLDIDLRVRAKPLKRKPGSSRAKRFWKDHFDPQERRWIDAADAREALDEIELTTGAVAGRKPQRFDLVIIDEAHRLGAKSRQKALQHLIKGNASKVLYVTATPFALNVCQLEELLGCFHFCTGHSHEQLKDQVKQLGLRDFERAVGLRETFPGQAELERKLRRWIVRRTWPHEQGELARHQETLAVPPDLGSGFVATVALERAIAELLRSAGRTHIASRRASLCSSWRAARSSMEENPLGEKGDESRRWCELAVKVLSQNLGQDSPKLRRAAERIASIVRKERTKVLVFAERKETLTAMRGLIEGHLADLQKERQRWRRNWRRDSLAYQKQAKGLSRKDLQRYIPVMATALKGSLTSWTKVKQGGATWVRRCLTSEQRRLCERKSIFGQLRSVEIFDGERGDEASLDRFNLPGAPWVLLCSAKAQESVDLHLECGTVVLLDPVWNPASREQRIGRVHRMNSKFKKIRVIDVYTSGTYEQVIFERATARARMMKVLLGAGKWLDEDIELGDEVLHRYRIDLAPKESPGEDLP